MKAKQVTRKSNFCYLYWTPQKLAIRQVTLLFPGKKNEKVLNLHIGLYLHIKDSSYTTAKYENLLVTMGKWRDWKGKEEGAPSNG